MPDDTNPRSVLIYPCTRHPAWCSTQEQSHMAKRHKLSAGTSKRLFKRTASRTHKRNVALAPMRGGIRA